MKINKYKNLGSGWFSESQRHSNARLTGSAGGLYAKDVRMNRLKNYEKPSGYKYYNHFCTDKGCYIIWSRDGKRFYIDGGKDSKLILLPDTPFKKSSDAITYLKKRLLKKGLYAKSQIFYAKHMIDPRDSEYDEKIYSELHFSDSEKPVVMKRSYFDEKYGQLFTQEQVKKIPEDLEVIFSKYNSDSRNPIATPTGQESIKSRGIHHTSMSIGDVVRVVRSGNKPDDYFITANVGFRKLILE